MKTDQLILCPVYAAGESIDKKYGQLKFGKLISQFSKVQVVIIKDELEITKYLSNYGFIKVLSFPSHGSYGISNDTLYIKKKIKSPKLNTILKTYNLIRHNDGFYED